MKLCRTCGQTKPAEAFYRASPGKGCRLGLSGRCRACIAQKVREGREAKPEMYDAQKKRQAARMKERRAADPEPFRAYERHRYHNVWTPDKRRQRSRADYLRRSDAYKRNARQRRTRMDLVWTECGDKYAAIIAYDPCSYCGRPADTIDHVVPLIAGGGHEPMNLTAACRSCNCAKRDKPLLAFLICHFDSGSRRDWEG